MRPEVARPVSTRWPWGTTGAAAVLSSACSTPAAPWWASVVSPAPPVPGVPVIGPGARDLDHDVRMSALSTAVADATRFRPDRDVDVIAELCDPPDPGW